MTDLIIIALILSFASSAATGLFLMLFTPQVPWISPLRIFCLATFVAGVISSLIVLATKVSSYF